MLDLLEDFPVDRVVDEAVAQVRAEVPAFRTLDSERMRADIAGAMSLAVASVRDGVDRDGLEGDALRAIGAVRAEEGVDVDAMLAGFRIVARVTIDTMLEIARQRGVDSMASLELTRAVWVHCDDAAAALAAGHRAWTESPDRRAVTSTQAALRRLVRGDLTDELTAEACAELGLDVAGSYCVVLAGSGDHPLNPALAGRLLASYDDTTVERVVGVATSLTGESWGCPVGYGDRVPVRDLRASFHGALLAWEMAEAFGLDEPQHADDVRLLRAVHLLPEIGDAFVEQCFGHLDEARQEALRATLHAWFAAQGSTDAAAEVLFVHRNTLRYRLRSFTESTGLSLDRPEDSFAVWWAMRRLDEQRRHPEV
ncbi:helix-turn-helix domain-containing protein [Nocardioides panacis]|uniref:Helix-turn-helix domain-containing protein n=1 Tax=Nocardioides panacis TaxID=2849501 RepID=A0A975SX04_9ACTN|nr:PucR family transcriptional regulator [Nocardioides panacis]QWZ07484.1 helix-turn-helix domain-containing protein [Nocardioides panacis]